MRVWGRLQTCEAPTLRAHTTSPFLCQPASVGVTRLPAGRLAGARAPGSPSYKAFKAFTLSPLPANRPTAPPTTPTPPNPRPAGVEVTKLFVEYGADLDAVTPKDWTPLSYAKAKGKYGATEEKGIYPEVGGYWGAWWL